MTRHDGRFVYMHDSVRLTTVRFWPFLPHLAIISFEVWAYDWLHTPDLVGFTAVVPCGQLEDKDINWSVSRVGRLTLSLGEEKQIVMRECFVLRASKSKIS